ncbi:hypothetical protein CCMA1212_001834 [Trichoderma ghanense]|uniref:Uncharacterized protein n=1 Tax=Trichoderma ghanense TaxID=65468 RepID=A0ABY2HCC0_9HYPO
MARLDTPDVSDDDFAMVNSITSDNPPAVSHPTPKLISRLQPNQQQPSRMNHDSGSNGDAAASAAEKSPVPEDDSLSSSLYSQTKANVRSMYNKLRGKDILIAVMGYAIRSTWYKLNGLQLTLRTA